LQGILSPIIVGFSYLSRCLDGTLLLLASPGASGFMTGTTVIVDGGIALK
jgi:hypothetical protein